MWYNSSLQSFKKRFNTILLVSAEKKQTLNCQQSCRFSELSKKKNPSISSDQGLVLSQDDIIDNAEAFIAAADILKERGAYKIYIMATHGLLSADAPRLIEESAIDEVKKKEAENPGGVNAPGSLRPNSLGIFECLCSRSCRWWWPTPCPMTCRSSSAAKSKPWMSAWSWLRPSAASTTGSPWLICSATSPSTTEDTHACFQKKKKTTKNPTVTSMTKNHVYCFNAKY